MKPTLNQLKRLVGNPGAYSVQQDNGSYIPVRSELTDGVLRSHLEGLVTVGTYIGHVVDGVTISRTLCFDVDSGEKTALIEVQRIKEALLSLGVSEVSLGIEFSGKKGYHLWLPLADYRPNTELRRVGRAALFLAGVDCEVYPKQDNVRDLGNLVKLPGGVHRVSGNHNDFVDHVPLPLPSLQWLQLLEVVPDELAVRRKVSDSRFPCMAAIQNEGCAEGGRNIQLFHLATLLLRAGVTDENVEVLVRKTNQLGDPLDDVELEALLDSSKMSGPICEQLPKDRHCGELCIKARSPGLYTRPGQLRYAAVGEKVVVTLSGRDRNVVEFEHDDVGRMKAVLR
jgi:hypothetical protein